jgi:hypothetical protein
MHYTELCSQLKSHGFNCNIYDNEEVVPQPRIYINGYDKDAKIYLFYDPKRNKNDFSNPIHHYGLHVGIKSESLPQEKMKRRCEIKHQVMTDLWKAGFAMRPCPANQISL